MVKINRLVEVNDIRKVWPKEAKDFTPWLMKEENFSSLCDSVGFGIRPDDNLPRVGRFIPDIVATEIGTDNKVVIENQFGKSDHDHLGKLITYASGIKATSLIWIVEKANDAHREAVSWINNHTDNEIGVYLCEIKSFQISNSEYGVWFNVVEKPNEWSRVFKCMSELDQQRFEYWSAFSEYASNLNLFKDNFNRRKPSAQMFVDYSIGSSTCHISIAHLHRDKKIRVELYISGDRELYNRLYKNKNQIEEEVGESLIWRSMEKDNRIIADKVVSFSESRRNNQFDWIIDHMVKMKRAYYKYS